LTATIIVGWTLHVLILGSWTSLGYTQGFVGGEPAFLFLFLLPYRPASWVNISIDLFFMKRQVCMY